MRGPSIFSFLCILFLLGYIFMLHKRIGTLECELDTAKDDIYKKFGEDMSELKTDVGKQTEAIKGLCKTLDNVQRDIRQIREMK